MNVLAIGAIIAGLLIIGSIAVVNAVNADEEILEANTDTISCSTCGNSCSAERNCGRSTCGAVSGGSCGCGR